MTTKAAPKQKHQKTHVTCVENLDRFLLLMAKIPNNHLGCMKPYNNGKNYQPQLVNAGFQPSTSMSFGTAEKTKDDNPEVLGLAYPETFWKKNIRTLSGMPWIFGASSHGYGDNTFTYTHIYTQVIIGGSHHHHTALTQLEASSKLGNHIMDYYGIGRGPSQ